MKPAHEINGNIILCRFAFLSNSEKKIQVRRTKFRFSTDFRRNCIEIFDPVAGAYPTAKLSRTLSQNRKLHIQFVDTVEKNIPFKCS